MSDLTVEKLGSAFRIGGAAISGILVVLGLLPEETSKHIQEQLNVWFGIGGLGTLILTLLLSFANKNKHKAELEVAAVSTTGASGTVAGPVVTDAAVKKAVTEIRAAVTNGVTAADVIAAPAGIPLSVVTDAVTAGVDPSRL